MINIKTSLFVIIRKLFFIFLIFGNLVRFISISGFSDNFNVLEFILYGLVFLYISMFEVVSIEYFFLLILSAIILTSSFYGWFLHGFHFSCFLYAIRLIFMCFSGYLIGKIFYEEYKSNISGFFNRILRVYFFNSIIGFIIYVVFPESSLFWNILEKYNIVFHGDPHSGRFISSYFDPNFYGAIASIPFLAFFSSGTLNKLNVITSLLIVLSLFLTFSRSGITTFIMLCSCLFFFSKFFSCRFSLGRNYLFLFPFVFISFVVFVFCKFDSLVFFLYRFENMTNDISALGRLYSFKHGLKIFSEHPFLGIGYNYLMLKIRDFSGCSSIDSSLLAIFATFGLVFSLIYLVVFSLWSLSAFRKLKSLGKLGEDLYVAFRNYYIYLVISILFTSNFNNLLFYPFWLLPMVVIFSYLSMCIKEKRQTLLRIS